MLFPVDSCHVNNVSDCHEKIYGVLLTYVAKLYFYVVVNSVLETITTRLFETLSISSS